MFKPARAAVRRYLTQDVWPPRRAETVLAAIAQPLLAFATAGGLVLWHMASHGMNDLGNAVDTEKEIDRAFSKAGLLFLFASVVVAPVVEEIVFRGFLFDAWKRRWGWEVSAVLTSTVFGIYHPYFFAAFAASIVFACVIRRTGSIRAAIMVHSFGNLVLWTPLLGQYVLPHVESGPDALRAWIPHLTLLFLAALVIPIYFWMARKHPAPDQAAIENQNRA